jgi:hypothetical protein
MKSTALILFLCGFSGAALAQECRAIPKASDRLACYDKLDPPNSIKQRSAIPKSPSGDQTQMIDGLAVENARLDKKIGNICRGC